MMTRDTVIKARQAEIVNEVFEIESRMSELRDELERLAILKEQRMMEHQLLEEVGERSILGEHTPGRKSTRLSFEDTLIQIYDNAGRPLRIKELIGELERFGYQWSNYYTAYSYITSSHIVAPTGARGYYNVVRGRG